MISVDALGFLGMAFLLLILPLPWVLAAATAALVHELCHMLTVILLGGKLRRISVGLTWCRIDTEPMDALRSVLCIAAGPMGSFLLILIRSWAPQIAACGLIQGIYNLLPVLPLDGGRILEILVRCLPSSWGKRIMDTVFGLVCVAILLIGILAAWYRDWKIGPVAGSVIFCIALFRRKIPCNAHGIGLQ